VGQNAHVGGPHVLPVIMYGARLVVRFEHKNEKSNLGLCVWMSNCIASVLELHVWPKYGNSCFVGLLSLQVVA